MRQGSLATPEIVHAPDRILNPKKRVGASWKDITWDEALNAISQKLSALKKDPGPESLVVHYGVSQVRTPFYRYFLRRFSNVYETPNFTGCGSQCAIASAMARAYSTGALADMEMNKHQPFKAKGITTDVYPLLWQKSSMITANKVPEAILTGRPYPVKALMVVGGNPVITGPNASHMKEAYRRLELPIVMDLFMTGTAKMADIVLPAATSLECDNFKATDRMIYMTPKVIAEQGNAWPVWKFWFELAKKMGYTAEFPWKTLDDAIDEHLSPVGITASELRRNFNGVDYHSEVSYKKFEKDGFHTPSGKIEFSSKTLAEAGYDPLPAFVEPNQGANDNLSSKQYPFLMSSGARIPVYYHSQFHNIPSLRAKAPQPILEVNASDASNLGITEGEAVNVTSSRGSTKVKTTIVPLLSAGTVAMSHGWNETNVNELTDDAVLDPISGFPAYRGFLCRVEKA